MATKKTASQNPSGASAEKQGVQALEVLNKCLVGKFNSENSTTNYKMNWGGHMVEQYLTVAIPQKADRKTILTMLEKAQVKEYLSAAPSGCSPLDVLEFYNNSMVYTKLVDGVEESYIKTEVQGKEIYLDCAEFCRIFGLRNLGDDFDINTKDKILVDGVK